ncbi:MAG: hypothetical protein EP318_21460 [Rhodobacteraceae bacterium]|nr:MAG: hypothetical protein EP318_21460 [Paracoccaceae bacterium]
MLHPDQIKRHAVLMDKMAETRGIDMEEQVLRGNISSAEVAESVLSCTNCTNPGDCANWLAENRGPVAETPSYCRNATLFDDLLKF